MWPELVHPPPLPEDVRLWGTFPPAPPPQGTHLGGTTAHIFYICEYQLT